jgi:hypothetical protein
VGFYYGLICVQTKQHERLWTVVITSILWLGQFLIFYLILLKPQINSSYLQGFHKDYFLFASFDKEQLKHNYYVLLDLLTYSTGFYGPATIVHQVLIVLAVIIFVIKKQAKGSLILIPIILVVIAAMAHQFSLIPRVSLFIMPLLLILIGVGADLLFSVRFKAWRILLVITGLWFVYQHENIGVTTSFVSEPITTALEFLRDRGIKGDKVYIHTGARPAMIYYTQMHPRKEQWSDFQSAHLLQWAANYEEISMNAEDRFAMVFTNVSSTEKDQTRIILGRHATETIKFEKPEVGCYVYIFSKK